MDQKIIGLTVGALVLGALGGYFIGGSAGGQVTQLQTQIAGLQAQITTLQQNITATMAELTRLRAIHTFTVGSTLTTLSGGYEDRTGPAFHIPAGHVKITTQLTSLGDIRTFYLYIYKIGQSYSVWSGHTDAAGTWTNYAYSLPEGDYYLEINCVNFNWQVTIQVYA